MIIANDLNSLPLSLKLAIGNGAKVFLDAHEYEPLHFDNKWHFNFFFRDYWHYIAKEYLPRVDAMTTVCESLAAEYRNNYGVSCEVITNASYFHPLVPTGMHTGRIRMIHHGICSPSRRIENMIELMGYLDERFSLDLMLVPKSQRQFAKISELAAKKPNVRICDPVPLNAIVPKLNNYDIGLHLMPPESFNNKMALPNKLFEFIQGRLGIAIWPSPEMAALVKSHHLGVVADDFNIPSMASALNKLSYIDIINFKENSHSTANILCAEQNRIHLHSMVSSLLDA